MSNNFESKVLALEGSRTVDGNVFGMKIFQDGSFQMGDFTPTMFMADTVSDAAVNMLRDILDLRGDVQLPIAAGALIERLEDGMDLGVDTAAAHRDLPAVQLLVEREFDLPSINQ
jgi:hypothetical protein